MVFQHVVDGVGECAIDQPRTQPALAGPAAAFLHRLGGLRRWHPEQLRLQEKKAEAAQRAQDLLVEKLQAQGTVLSSGRTGKSIAMLTSDAEREYGRDLANLGTNLGYATQSYGFNVQDIFAEAESANNIAASQRMIEPTKAYVAPPAAVMRPGSPGLILGIGQAALGAAGTYGALKAPKGKIPTPKPTPKAAGKATQLFSPAGKAYYGPAFGG